MFVQVMCWSLKQRMVHSAALLDPKMELVQEDPAREDPVQEVLAREDPVREGPVREGLEAAACN